MYDPTKPTKAKVLDLIQSTWNSPHLKIQNNTYAIFKKKAQLPKYEVDHTDGIGTKGYYHWKKRTFKNAVLDALAMNLNDLLLVRATAFKLQNHIVLPKDDSKAIYEIMEALVSECKKRNIAITGGETSIQNTSDGMDMSISVSGFVKEIVENRFQSGDVLIGLKSNGLHSNGFTKIREFFKEKIKKDFTEPTKIYVEEIMPVSKYINGMMHMTGGAFTKLKDLLDSQSDVLIHRNHNLKPLPIFTEIYKKGLSDEKMYKTFNCGIGFIISVPKNHVEKVLKKLNGSIIGEVIPGHGQVIVQSKFSNAEVIY